MYPFCQKRQAWLLACLVGIVVTGVSRSQPANPPTVTAPAANAAEERKIYFSLREVIIRGAKIFNDDRDANGCYHLYIGGLLAVKPLLVNHPDLQKAIESGLVQAAQQSTPEDRAFAARRILDDVRAKLKPAVARKPVNKPKEGTAADAKPPDGKPVTKPEDTAKPPVKKPTGDIPDEGTKKPADTKPAEDKKPTDKKPAETKDDTKKPADDKKPGDKKDETKPGDKKDDKKPADKNPPDKKD